MILGWWCTGLRFVQRRGEGVVSEFHRPGEVVIQLKPIHPAAFHYLHHQADETFADLGMGRVEPHHFLAVHGHHGVAVSSSQDPLRLLTHDCRISRLHQAVFKPWDDLHPALTGLLTQRADGIELNSGFFQGRFNRCETTAMKGCAAAPHIGIDRIESCGFQLIHGLDETLTVVVKTARAVGQPYPQRASGLHGGQLS